jgi:hypothetical protein
MPAPVEFFVAEEDADEDPPIHSLYIGQEFHGRGLPEEIPGLLAVAVWGIHAAIPQTLKDFLFLHSGAVARDGAGLLLPAPMDSGKSTLVLALLSSGFQYLSDELGVLDPVTGKAYPFPKRIGMDAAGLSYFPGLEEAMVDRRVPPIILSQRYVQPQDVGSSVAEPAEIRYVVFPSPVWDGTPQLAPISKAETVQRMASNAFNLNVYEDRGVVLLSRIAARAEAYTLEGGTPLERAQLLAEHLN